jgi:hypothetical protein
MEQFGARTQAPLETCLAEVDISDVYIGIIALRLGSIHAKTGKSYTQMEYERANKHGKEILIYLIDEEKAKVSPKSIDFGERHEKLVAFKKLLSRRHTVSKYDSPDDPIQKLRRDFQRLLTSRGERSSPTNTFTESKKVLDRFFLLPKDTSGTEIRVKVQLRGRPFAASKLLCEAFNLEFGSTIGIEAPILEPAGFVESGLDHIFIDAKQADYFLELEKGETLDIWARVQFADLEAAQDRARFTREVEIVRSMRFKITQQMADSLQMFSEPEEVIQEPDGKLILLFTRPYSDD